MKYKILNYWNDQDDLYVNYIIKNLETGDQANVINYYDVSDLDCNYNMASMEEIENSLYRLIEQGKGKELTLPKVSKLSPLLKYVYDFVCESESNMCHIDYNDWEELKEEQDFTDEDFETLNQEVDDYALYDYITLDDGEYKICGYGCFQTMFNDDRRKESDELER